MDSSPIRLANFYWAPPMPQAPWRKRREPPLEHWYNVADVSQFPYLQVGPEMCWLIGSTCSTGAPGPGSQVRFKGIPSLSDRSPGGFHVFIPLWVTFKNIYIYVCEELMVLLQSEREIKFFFFRKVIGDNGEVSSMWSRLNVSFPGEEQIDIGYIWVKGLWVIPSPHHHQSYQWFMIRKKKL